MPLISCEISLVLTLSLNCFLAADTVANQVPTFAMTTKIFYVPVTILATHSKLLEQLNFVFKRKINRSEY